MVIQQQKQYKILVIGDSCLDKYHFGRCPSLSPEAPVPIFKLCSTETKPGMAANVEKNLIAHGNSVDILSNNQSLITKERFIDLKSKQQLMRLDTGEEQPLTFLNLEGVDVQKYDCVVISDYNKGAVEPRQAQHIAEQCKRHQKLLFVDSKKYDLSCFEESIIKINETESGRVFKYPEHYDIVITLGERGARWRNTLYQSASAEVFDVCGAGDTFFAALISDYLQHRKMPDAIKFANACAAITVSKIGAYSPTPEELQQVRSNT